MTRVGFQTEDENFEESLKEIIEVSKMPNIHITGIFTHHAVADAYPVSYTHLDVHKRQVLDGEEGPLYRMAKAWQQMYGCSVATDTKKGRGKMLMNKMAQTGADAVIIAQMKFCDPEEWDYPVMYREFEERGVKNLMIEVDQEVTSFEQVKTRLQSFVEMM